MRVFSIFLCFLPFLMLFIPTCRYWFLSIWYHFPSGSSNTLFRLPVNFSFQLLFWKVLTVLLAFSTFSFSAEKLCVHYSYLLFKFMYIFIIVSWKSLSANSIMWIISQHVFVTVFSLAYGFLHMSNNFLFYTGHLQICCRISGFYYFLWRVLLFVLAC